MSIKIAIALALVIVPLVIFCIRAGCRLVRHTGGKTDQTVTDAKRPGHWLA